MEIAIIASDKKKELMTEFCIAYCGILSRHNLCATATTGKYISEATGLEIEKLLAGSHGGQQQIASRIAFNEIDLLLIFRDTASDAEYDDAESSIIRMCDVQNIPVATNIATAEALILALDRGDLDWRMYVNPRYSDKA
ncbi:MAG: methylglyoxal synthase [Clostridia bacterium]|nr:methylglyoxal synthase [Clostridia bacterium]